MFNSFFISMYVKNMCKFNKFSFFFQADVFSPQSLEKRPQSVRNGRETVLPFRSVQQVRINN